ncbi:MAG TPA: FG-GAP-like repeat-containing protein [Vicinamibacterales bacterium]|nr:FG-GAP-like repeat-containing protein [Vicinamibacterales bacterium]
MRQYRFAPVCLALIAILTLDISEVRAQITPVGSPFPSIVASVRGNGIAFDPKNKVYLTVATYGTLRGQFVSEDGALLGSTFVIPSGGSYTHFPSVAYSPDADGGTGAFLVVWHASDLAGERTSIHARLVSVDRGGPFGPDNQVGADSSFYEAPVNVAYSKPAERFVVVWGTKETANVSGVLLNNSAAAVGALRIAASTDGERWAGVACHESKPECLVSYSGWSSSAFVRSVIVNPATGIVDAATLAEHRRTSGIWQTDALFNAATGEYLVVWYQEPGNGLYARRVAATSGVPTSESIVISTRFASKDSVDLAYNPATGTSLYVSHDLLSTNNDGAVEIAANGNPLSASTILLLPTNSGNYYPSVAANPSRSEWMAIASHRFLALYGQRVATTSVGTTPPAPTPSAPPPPPPPAPVCSYSLSSSSASFGNLGGSGGVTLNASAGNCPWTATSSASWLGLSSSSSSGTGSKLVSFGVGANTDTSVPVRTATLTIGGQTFTVGQARPCTFAINPPNHEIYSGAADGAISVTTDSHCAWSASSQSDFLQVQISGGVGPGKVPFHIDANLSTSGPRTGTAIVAGLTFTLAQNAAPFDAERIQRENARADFDVDGRNDLLWQHDSGPLAVWALLGGTTIKNGVDLKDRGDSDWRIAGTGDFNADGRPDIVWQHRTEGWVYLWYMNGFNQIGGTYLSLHRMPSAGWNIVGVGNFDAKGQPDIVWQHPEDGWLSVWLVDGVTVTNVPLSPSRLTDPEWEIAGVGDFNGDDKSDLLWRHRLGGDLGVWLMDGLTNQGYVPLNPGRVPELDWKIASILDINGDGTHDLVWRHTQGWVAAWFMNGTTRVSAGSFDVAPSPSYKLVGPK